LRYGEPVIKRAVPLALGLLSTSNPKLQILDTLSKFSHDSDPEVAHNAIFSMGIVGAGKIFFNDLFKDLVTSTNQLVCLLVDCIAH
jgi:hypothetical protein